MALELNDTQKRRFWSHVEINHEDDCWEWTAAIGSHGYGCLWIHPKLQLVHRISWCLFFGGIPSEMKVLHHCDNRPCINPKHLFIGTGYDNAMDKVRKNRHNASNGESHYRAKLTKNDVLLIRSSYPKCTQNVLALLFNVSRRNIRSILNGDSWRTVS